MPNVNDLKQSNFLTQNDVDPPVLVTVAACKQVNVAREGADPEYRWCLYFREEEKPMTLNVTNGQIIASIIGSDEINNAIGHKIVLYRDPNVMFAGNLVGGIRCRAPKTQRVQEAKMPETKSDITNPDYVGDNPPAPVDDDMPFQVKTMEFHYIKQDGKLTLSPTQRELRERFVASLKEGAFIKEILKREGNVKTYKQVKTQFGLVVEMVRSRLNEMGVDICGVSCNKAMVYDILKKACGGVGDMGEVLGLSEMTTAQASQFFENCRAWAATQLQLNIPDPDVNWRQKRQ